MQTELSEQSLGRATSKRTRAMQTTDHIVRVILFACALLLVITIIAVFVYVGMNGIQSFSDYGGSQFPTFFTSNNWNAFPDSGLPTFGARDFIIGSAITTFFSTIIAAPLAFCVALFFNELAPKGLIRFCQPLLEIFVGIPSVVIGFLGLVVIGPFIGNLVAPITHSATGGYGFAIAIIVLIIMILPTITSVSIDALRAVPSSVREASYALGSTRWQTMWKAILPAAAPALVTAVILGLSRAIGETLAVSMVLGGSSLPDNLFSLQGFFTPTTSITREIVQDFQESAGSPARDAIWLLAFTLLVISFLFICVSRYFASRSVYK
ncbi:putative ABC transporter permease protein YqgH [Ktedonobacteria bacterium brp13]|nr:putative ABC transporter permease protein YqgH [Ktedonobacteria bacterium brp13]